MHRSDDNTRYSRYLLAVVEEASFSKAANRLGVSQPAISRRIRLMEEGLGFPLLDRQKDKVVPTVQGEAMLPFFRDLVDAASDITGLIGELSAKRTQAPRIGVEHDPAQPERSELLAEFEAAHPMASFNIETGYKRALLDGLDVGRFDILSLSCAIPDDDMEYIVLRWLPVHVIVPGGSDLAAAEAIHLRDLAGLSLATWERDRSPQVFDNMAVPLREAGIELQFTVDQSKHGLLAFASDHRIAAIEPFDQYSGDDLGPAGMVARIIQDLPPMAALMLQRMRREGRPAGNTLWNFARQWSARRGVPQSIEGIGTVGR